MEADIDEPDHVWLGGDVTVYILIPAEFTTLLMRTLMIREGKLEPNVIKLMRGRGGDPIL